MLVIIRGLPGSGKSSMGRSIAALIGCAYVEPDMWLVSNGKYHYTPEEYDRAERCAAGHLESLGKMGADAIYADVLPLQTGVAAIEACYGQRARAIVSLRIGADDSRMRNRHNVSIADITRFADSWEAIPGEYVVNTADQSAIMRTHGALAKWVLDRATIPRPKGTFDEGRGR